MNDEMVKLGKYMAAYPIWNGRRSSWVIKDSGGKSLAYAEWYAPWKQYVVNFVSMAICSHDCLLALANFCKDLNSKQTNKKDARFIKNGCGNGSIA